MTGLDVIARLADTTVAAIREMNPQYLRLATPPGVASLVRIPSGRGPSTVAAYAELPPARRITFVEHTVARGETMSGIAARYHVSQRLLTEANPRLRGRMLRPGMRVIVPTGGAHLHLGGSPHGRSGGAGVEQRRPASTGCVVARRSRASRRSTASPCDRFGRGTGSAPRTGSGRVSDSA